MTKKIIFIMSDNRSGSTLLDQLLGANPTIMSLGEVHHLKAYALSDRAIYDPIHPLVCSCGKQISDCQFWSLVETRLGRPLKELRSRFRLFDRRRHKFAAKRFTKRRVAAMLARYPKLVSTPVFRSILNSKQLVKDAFDLFDAAFNVSGVDFLVDSSKSAIRMRTLFDAQPDRMIVIMLARNFRGTVHSKMKRDMDITEAIESWTRQIKAMKNIVSDMPSEQVIRVKYEDLCEDPAAELRRICSHIGVEYSADMLLRPSTDIHHIGGSPSKFDPERKGIIKDESYVDAFSDEQVAYMKKVVGDAAADWGYD